MMESQEEAEPKQDRMDLPRAQNRTGLFSEKRENDSR
jgi:hypothetical protein